MVLCIRRVSFNLRRKVEAAGNCTRKYFAPQGWFNSDPSAGGTRVLAVDLRKSLADAAVPAWKWPLMHQGRLHPMVRHILRIAQRSHICFEGCGATSNGAASALVPLPNAHVHQRADAQLPAAAGKSTFSQIFLAPYSFSSYQDSYSNHEGACSCSFCTFHRFGKSPDRGRAAENNASCSPAVSWTVTLDQPNVRRQCQRWQRSPSQCHHAVPGALAKTTSTSHCSSLLSSSPSSPPSARERILGSIIPAGSHLMRALHTTAPCNSMFRKHMDPKNKKKFSKPPPSALASASKPPPKAPKAPAQRVNEAIRASVIRYGRVFPSLRACILG